MAVDSSNKLTKYTDGVVVTQEVANKWFGGLYGSSDADLLSPTDPQVIGHAHDGVHSDGHAQKINLVSHVTGQLTNTNLADGAVRSRNILGFTSQASAIPESYVDGATTYYNLDLSDLRQTIDQVDNVFVYHPGGTASENVYTDFSLLYTDLQLRSGLKVVHFDETDSSISLPAATYDFSDTIFTCSRVSAAASNKTTVTLPEGVIFSEMPDVIDGITLSFTNTATPVYTFGSDGDESRLLIFIDSSIIGSSHDFISMPTTAAIGRNNLILKLFGTSNISDGGGTIVTCSGNGAAARAPIITIYGYDHSSLADDLINDDTTPNNATLNLEVCSPASTLSQTQTAGSNPVGTINYTLNSNSENVAYDNSTSGMSATEVKSALDEAYAVLPKGYISGLNLSYNSASTVQISAGECRDDTDVANMVSSGTLTANITSSGANGLDDGEEANSTIYHAFIISQADGTVASLLSVSKNSPTMPSGYIYKRYVGIVKNDGSSAFIRFTQMGEQSHRNYYYHIQMGASGARLLSDATPLVAAYTTVSCSAWIPQDVKEVMVSVSDSGSATITTIDFRPNGSSIDRLSSVKLLDHRIDINLLVTGRQFDYKSPVDGGGTLVIDLRGFIEHL